MSECGLQDTPKDVLSFFHPTPHRHHRPGKLDNHCDRNYTLKLPLSLIVTMHYAVDRNCRKRAFPGLPDECSNRHDGDLLTTGPPPLLIAGEVANGLLKGLRNRQAHLSLRAMKHTESVVPPAQIMRAQGHC